VDADLHDHEVRAAGDRIERIPGKEIVLRWR